MMVDRPIEGCKFLSHDALGKTRIALLTEVDQAEWAVQDDVWLDAQFYHVLAD